MSTKEPLNNQENPLTQNMELLEPKSIISKIYNDDLNPIKKFSKEITHMANNIQSSAILSIDENIMRKIFEPMSMKNLLGDFFEPLKMQIPVLSSPLEEMWAQLSLSPFWDLLINSNNSFNNTLINNVKILGRYEWCYLNICHLNGTDLSNGPIPKDYNDFFGGNPIPKSMDIDKFVMKYFTKEIIVKISTDTCSYLNDNDLIKFNRAMIDFRARRYFECASLLGGLIDSQSIKQSLYDINKGKYIPNEKGQCNIDQGWHTFCIVFKNNFTKYFNNAYFENARKAEKRRNNLDDFINESKPNMNDNIVLSLIHLAFCLLQFFDDSDWKNYPDNKPDVINRHWLMHGMYDYNDITKSDCVKLLLMLNQMSGLYYKLREGEI